MVTTCHTQDVIKLGQILKGLLPEMSSISVGSTRTVSLSDSTFWEIFTAWAMSDCGSALWNDTLLFVYTDSHTGSMTQVSVRKYPGGRVLIFVYSDQIQQYPMIHSLLHGLLKTGKWGRGLIRCFAHGIAARLRVASPAGSVGTEASTSASPDTRR